MSITKNGPHGTTSLDTSTERRATTFNGYVMLLVLLALVATLAFLFATLGGGDGIRGIAWLPLVVLAVASLLVASGFYLLQPNQAAAIQLFGAYVGTDRTNGLRWVWPWLSRRKLSTRIHNVTSEKIKVNDLRGNPVEIAANVVWRVEDTAKALFDVEAYQEFVEIQIESAVRAIGAHYPYDSIEDDEVTLRGSAEEVALRLEAQLQERVARAGVVIDESRLTHLAYAPEIAQAMLRRQQADAIISARARIVAGAVGMVEMALAELSSKGIVSLDDERKAAMVSNLMVVLCSERDTQPVVNAGSLYQ